MTNTTPAPDSIREMLVSVVENTPNEVKPTGWRSRRFTMAGALGLTLTGAVAGGALSAAALTIGGQPVEPPPIPPGQFQEFNVAYIAAFDRPAEASDQLPAELPDYAIEELKTDTSRLVGEFQGSAIYLVEGSQVRSPVCAVAWSGPQTWIVGCGGLPMKMAGLGVPDVRVVPSGEPLAAGETRLDENVIVSESD